MSVLEALARPKTMRDVVVKRGGSARGEPLSVQAIYEKKDALMEVGLVIEAGAAEGGAALFVIDRRAIHAMVRTLRRVAMIDAVQDAGVTAGVSPSQGRTNSARSGPQACPVQPSLVCVDGVAVWSTYPLALRGGAITFGRAAEARLPWDPTLSARHFTVQTDEAGWALRDEGSRNGTFVDGRRVPPGTTERLRPGQLVTAGLNTFVLHPGR